MDGYEVCHRLRNVDNLRFIKIVMVSTQELLESRLKGYESGADDYIVKPFNKDELLAKVRVFLRIKYLEDQLKKLNKNLHEQVQIRSQQLLDAEKMAMLGRHTAGIVHNLSTPLQVIMGAATNLGYKYPDDRNIRALEKAAERMKQIVETIILTSRKEFHPVYEQIDLNEVIQEQIELLSANPFFKNQVQKNLNLEDLPPYHGIYAHFSQSIGNLIRNAVEAMYDAPTRILNIQTESRKGFLSITIQDTGHGISSEEKENIFNPFFTTKPLSAEDDRPTGTGLGLASARDMIESYGGVVLVDSEPGIQTTFTVLLPLSQNKT
jgi:signal transduction histidine kinase